MKILLLQAENKQKMTQKDLSIQVILADMPYHQKRKKENHQSIIKSKWMKKNYKIRLKTWLNNQMTDWNQSWLKVLEIH